MDTSKLRAGEIALGYTILEILKERGPQHALDLFKSLGKNASYCYRACAFLRAEGLAHICEYRGEHADMILKAGAGVEPVKPKSRGPRAKATAMKHYTIPAPDPLLAAFYGR